MADRGQAAADDVLFDWADFENDTDCAQLYCLTQKEVDLLLSLCRYAEWPTRWVTLPPDNFVTDLEDKLLTNCVSDLIIAERLLIGALTGTVVNLDEPLPTSGQVSFEGVGFDKWLNTTEGKTVAITLQEILDQMETMASEQPDYTELLTIMIAKLSLIKTILSVIPA